MSTIAVSAESMDALSIKEMVMQKVSMILAVGLIFFVSGLNGAATAREMTPTCKAKLQRCYERQAEERLPRVGIRTTLALAFH
jgi:hypothetical protein